MPTEFSTLLKPPAFAPVPELSTPSLTPIYGENHTPAHRTDSTWNPQIEQLISKIKVFCNTHRIDMIGEENDERINLLGALAEQIKVNGSRVNFMDYRKQSDAFFETVKGLLETFYLLLAQPDIDLSRKIKTVKEFLPQCIACTTGLAMAVSDAVNTLTPGNALIKTLTNLRTTYIKLLAEILIAKKNIPDGLSPHIHRAFVQYSIQQNWNPSDTVIIEELNDEYFSNVTDQDLEQFHRDFLTHYSLQNIVEHLTVELHTSVQQAIRTFPLTLQHKRSTKAERLTEKEIHEETERTLSALRQNPLAQEFFPEETEKTGIFIYEFKEDQDPQENTDSAADISAPPASQEESYPDLPIQCAPAHIFQPFIVNGLAKKGIFTEEVRSFDSKNTKHSNECLHVAPAHPHFSYLTYETVDAEHKTIRYAIPLENKRLEKLIEALPEHEEISANFIATLLYAESAEHSPIIWTFLQKHPVDLNQSLNQAGETALQRAVKNQNIDCLHALLESLKNRGSDNNFLAELFAQIAEFGTLELIEKTIPSIKKLFFDDKQSDSLSWDNFLILPYAAKNPDPNCLRYFLRSFTYLAGPLQQTDAEEKTALDHAAERGLAENVQVLLDKHREQASFVFPQSAIDIALKNEQCTCAWLILETTLARGAFDAHDPFQYAASAKLLLLAVKQKKSTVVRTLLKKIAQFTSAHIAQALEECAAEDKETAEALLLYYLNQIFENRTGVMQAHSDFLFSNRLLTYFATKGTVKACEALFAVAQNNSTRGFSDYLLARLLSTAAEVGNTDVVRYLCEKHDGKRLHNERSLYPQLTPLMEAAKNGHKSIAEVLIQYGANIEEKYKGESPACFAIKNGHTATAQVLLRYTTEPTEFALNTPLHLAISVGNKTIVEQLLSSAPSDPTTCRLMLNQSPYQKMSSFQKMKREIALHMDILCTGMLGVMAIHERNVEFFFGSTRIFNHLYENMCETLHEKRKNYRCKILTPLALAVSQGHEEVAELLINRGANVNQSLANQQTPLEIAIKKESVALVKLLLDNGANVLQKWQIRKTPLQLAKKTKNSEIIRLIETKIEEKTATRNDARQSFSTTSCFSFFHSKDTRDRQDQDNDDQKMNEKTPLLPYSLSMQR